jgi:hypothetical protein
MKLMILAVIAPFFFLSYQDHPRERPKTHCTPQKLNPKTRKLEKSCECLNNNGHEGCKNGKRDTEMMSCTNYCWKDTCSCCLS